MSLFKKKKNLKARAPEKEALLTQIAVIVDVLMKDEKKRKVFHSRGLNQIQRVLNKYRNKDPDTSAIIYWKDNIDSDEMLKELKAIAKNRLKMKYSSRDENGRDILYVALKEMNIEQSDEERKYFKETVLPDIQLSIQAHAKQAKNKVKPESKLKKFLQSIFQHRSRPGKSGYSGKRSKIK